MILMPTIGTLLLKYFATSRQNLVKNQIDQTIKRKTKDSCDNNQHLELEELNNLVISSPKVLLPSTNIHTSSLLVRYRPIQCGTIMTHTCPVMFDATIEEVESDNIYQYGTIPRGISVSMPYHYSAVEPGWPSTVWYFNS